MVGALAHTAIALARLMLYHLSGVIPRRPDLWLFGHFNNSFSGNSKFLFLWVNKHAPHVRAVWMTGDRQLCARLRAEGYRSELRNTPMAMAVGMRAGAYVYSDRVSDIGGGCSKGAFLANLWHGSGLKEIGFGNARSILNKGPTSIVERWKTLEATLMPDMIVATSPAIAERFSVSFRLPIDRCPVLGSARLDCATDEALRMAAARFEARAEWDAARSTFTEIYVYSPTYRQGNREFMREALPDLAALSDVLAARDAVLFIKPHPRDTAGSYSTVNIRPWPKGTESYSVMTDIDCLISDYSSIMFDYLAVRSAGMMLYPLDLGRFVDERGFYFPYDESTAGVRVDTFAELLRAISSGRAVAEVDPADLARVRERCWAGSAHPACAAVAAEIGKRLDR